MRKAKVFIHIILAIVFFISCKNSIHYPDGGYDYPKHIADKDTNFYYYPLKDIISKNDSLHYATAFLGFKNYNEPNLSLHPLPHDKFRLVYSPALGGLYIISLNKNSIQIKKEIYHEETLYDESRLTQEEQKLLNIIGYNYPYDNLSKNRKRYIDSLKTINPGVLTPAYYIYLSKKISNYIDPLKIYSTTTIRITDEDFKHLVTTINNSGYWKMPYFFNCEDASADGYGYSLEANTNHKYNFVSAASCSSLSEQQTKFSKACQEIINYAHLKNEISVWFDGITDTVKNNMVYDVPLEPIEKPVQKH